MKPPSKIKDEKKRDWRVYHGAIGVEFSLCGFGAGRNLFHRFLRLGVVTIYVATKPLHRIVERDASILAVARGQEELK